MSYKIVDVPPEPNTDTDGKVDTLSHSTADALRPSAWEAKWVSGTSDGLGDEVRNWSILATRPKTNEMSSREPLGAQGVNKDLRTCREHTEMEMLWQQAV